ncbi:acyl-CoA dehydrogenase family protein [Paenibacillus sp. BSR1-1]|uniref:acyl-CoA dehydrogenase family protein n=1 Tax=Paenibacillus sp. BSR1-1 TaxID=3020845 RepID=UPI0025B20D30|nr:acyl-CoA dehydrogenase family protein [Paenibacillus sp. BSR1-1]MDN3016178.1 acyl-CoA dehydrogenase family protein [Paenibacillus sp. BSR1-1]
MKQQAYEEFKTRLFEAIWRDLDPLEEEIENNEALPYDKLFPMLREMGAFGLRLPEEYGGLGLTVSQYIDIIAEFSKIQGGIRAVVHVHNSMACAFSKIANEEQRRAVLPGCVAGEKSVAFALTEPDHGTGLDLGTTATRDGVDFIINGRKHLITNSDFASHFIVFAKTKPGKSEDSVSAILVERDTPGFTIEPLPETMGCKGGEHGILTFENVRVPVANLLGEEGRGVYQLEEALEISRLYIAATSLGTAERAFDLSVQFAKERKTFGKPIAERQAIQRYIAEMGIDIYALRNMIKDAAKKWDSGKRIPAEASMCKQFGLEAVGRVTDRALLVFGGIGYTRKYPIERLYRDARLNWLEEGPPTIQYMVAAREFFKGYKWEE